MINATNVKGFSRNVWKERKNKKTKTKTKTKANMIKDRKSTRLNSSHTVISSAVFCLKKQTQPPATD